MRTVIFTAAAALFAVSFAQMPSFDNSKLQPLIGDWEGKAAMNDATPETSTIKGTKMLKDNWIRLDLKFTIEEMGPVEATALIASNEEGVVEGHFFASFAPGALIGKGKVVGKKLVFNVSTMDGEDSMVFEFDMSTADELKFNVSSPDSETHERISGTYKRKK